MCLGLKISFVVVLKMIRDVGNGVKCSPKMIHCVKNNEQKYKGDGQFKQSRDDAARVTTDKRDKRGTKGQRSRFIFIKHWQKKYHLPCLT